MPLHNAIATWIKVIKQKTSCLVKLTEFQCSTVLGMSKPLGGGRYSSSVAIGDKVYLATWKGEIKEVGPGLNIKEQRQHEKTGELTGKSSWKGTELGQLEKC